jgi:MFS family permease
LSDVTAERRAATRPAPAERRARWAVTAYFVITGAALATWTARIPAIKHRLGLDDATLSMALLAVAAGAVLAMQVVGHLTDRWGSATVMGPAGAMMSASLIIPGFAGGLPVLLVGLLLFGAGHGMVDVAMNTHAVRVEQRYGRPIMSTFHALFSVGGLLGAGLGALAAHVDMSAGVHFVIVGSVLAALSVIARPLLLAPERHRMPSHATERGRRAMAPAIVFLGVLGFFCTLGEGSMADWSAVYLRDDLHTSMAFAPIGFAVFATTMGMFRFLGDHLASRWGPVLLVRGCGVVAGVGLGGALLVHHPIAALIGFGLFGIGLSCIVPQVFSAAGGRDPERSGRDLAQVSTLAYGGLLAGPVVIGVTAHGFGLPLALGIPALLALLVAASANAVRPPS